MERNIVMIENENLVGMTENTETTVEETPVAKTYTQEEVDAIVGKKIARTKAKIQKEYDRKYGDLTDVLKAGTGKEDVEEMTDTFKKFYQSKGIKMPTKADYTAKDIEVLARAEAEDIIRSGFDEVVEETDRLSGLENMTAREAAVFKILAEHRHASENGNELAKIGVTEDVYNSPEFKEFHSMFDKNVPIAKVYETFAKTQPKKEFKTTGSMKNSTSADNTVKDFYTRDEALQFTKKDFDKNPALFKAVEASMLKW
jgi:hypothetical protein